MDISGIFAIIGCVAILVALIGGGIEVEKIKIPQLGTAIRIGSALLGVVFIVLAIFIWKPELFRPTAATQPAITLTNASLETATLDLSAAEAPTVTGTTIPEMYDDFNNAEFDDSFNPAKWVTSDNYARVIVQTNGALEFISTGISQYSLVSVTPLNFSNFTITNPLIFQADLLLGAGSLSSSMGMSLTISLPSGTFHSACGIDQTSGPFTAKCSDWFTTQQQEMLNQFSSPSIEVEPDSWHTFQIYVNPADMALTYTFDGQEVARHVPMDGTSLQEADFMVTIGLWIGSDTPVSGKVDNVRIGEIEP